MTIAQSLLPPSSTKCRGFHKEAHWTCPIREKCIRFFYFRADEVTGQLSAADQHFERSHLDPCPFASNVPNMTYREFMHEVYNLKYDQK